VAAVIYTVIGSCKKVELNPIGYIKYVIRENRRNKKPLTPLTYARHIREGPVDS